MSACLFSLWGLVDQELLVVFRTQETTEGVLLHQGIDPLLGQLKDGGGEIHQVPQGHILGEVVNVDLQMRMTEQTGIR